MAGAKRKKSVRDFTKMTDEELIKEIHTHGNSLAQRFLLEKYKRLVLGKAKSYFLVGAERDDVFQEGMIGLFKAIRDYKPDKQASFKSFADLCVGRQIITAVKNSTRQKQMPLNTYVSINKPMYAEDSEHTLLDVLAGINVANPEEVVVDQEEFELLEEEMNKILSPLEWEVLRLYLDGKSYQEMAQELGRHSKSVDNALTRIKKKISRYKDGAGHRINPRVMEEGLIALTAKTQLSRRKNKL